VISDILNGKKSFMLHGCTTTVLGVGDCNLEKYCFSNFPNFRTGHLWSGPSWHLIYHLDMPPVRRPGCIGPRNGWTAFRISFDSL